MNSFARSDLAAECGGEEIKGTSVRRSESGGCDILHVQIRTEGAASAFRKPIGRYVTVDCGEIGALGEQEMGRVKCALGVEIREMAERMCGKRVSSDFSLLAVGLGNADVTPDAVGPVTLKHLAVTRHLREVGDALLFPETGLCEIAALTPGVLGQTGIRAQELVRAAVSELHPDLVIAVDSLAARSVERLARTVQLADSGISPGSGLGKASVALNRESVGVPVMALGVPTVVDSSALVVDALAKMGIREARDEVRGLLERGGDFFVAPKEIDLLVERAGLLLARGIEKAFTVV